MQRHAEAAGPPEPPDGVFCYNDPVAAGAIKAVLETGLKVPGDIAIIGAGNVHYSDLLRVPLSTIDQSSSVIGETAADLLVECMETKSAAPAEASADPAAADRARVEPAPLISDRRPRVWRLRCAISLPVAPSREESLACCSGTQHAWSSGREDSS